MPCLVNTRSIVSQCVPEHVNVVKSACPSRNSKTSQAADAIEKVSARQGTSKAIKALTLYLPLAVDPISGNETVLGPPTLTQLAARKKYGMKTKIARYERAEVLP